MKKFLFAILLICNCLTINSFAQKKIVSNFIKILPFARAAGMGEAFCAISDGTYGLYYNPAALSTILGYEIHISNIYWLQGINYWYLGLINPDPILDWGKIGLSFSYFKVQRSSLIPDNSIIAWKEFDKLPEYLGNYSVNFASAIDFSKELSTGINLKWTYDYTQKVTGSNFSIDLGVIYKIKFDTNNLKIGFVLSSNGPKFRFIERGISLPDALIVAGAFEFNIFDKKTIFAIQAETEAHYKSLFNSGIEFYLNELFALRTGFKIGAYNTISAGIGYKNKNIEINYAYENYEKFGSCHYLSFILTWGTPFVKFNIVPDIFSPNSDGKFDKIYLMPVFRDVDFIKNAKINIFKDKKYIGEIPVIDCKINKIEWDGKVNGKILKNGEYELFAEAEYVINGSSESQKINVLIDTEPPELSVKGQPKYLKPGQKEALLIPATFYFNAIDKAGISEWSFEIRDKNNNIFFNTRMEGDPPLEFLWNGVGNNGEYINTGEFYYYTFYAEDNVGNKNQTKPEYQIVLLKEIKLTFFSDTIFEKNKADVKIESFSKLKQIKDVLEKYTESEIIIIGYADRTESGNYKTEEDLALARANAIKFFIEDMLQVKDKKIMVFGYGSKGKVENLKREEEKQGQRRVEVIIKSTVYE